MARRRASILPEGTGQPAKEPKKKQGKQIIPSKQFEELKAKKMRGDLPGTEPPIGTSIHPGDCPMCDICETAFQKGGFVFCHEGVPFVLNDWPATGGPWAPAVYPNGNVVWVNEG